MDPRKRKNALMGLIGGLGVVAFLGSLFGGLYSPGMGLFLALAFWIVGATLVNVFYD